MKKFYTITAIPYVNDKPHLGHGMDYIIADAVVRYRRQLGDEVFYQVGLDEHGTKVAQKAAGKNLQPQAFVDSLQPAWQTFYQKLNIVPTAFVRTTSPAHIKGAQTVWRQL